MSGGALDKYREAIKAELRRHYSETVAEHATNPKNFGDLKGYSGFAIIAGPDDTMAIWLKVENDTITRATFTTDGYATTVAAGSMVTELVKGKPIAQAREISQQDVLTALGGLPEERKHSALLAANTLNEAIGDYLSL